MGEGVDIDDGRIAGLLASLRTRGHKIGVGQELAFYDLMLSLAAGDQTPLSPEDIADHLTPILAMSRHGQVSIHRIITSYLREKEANRRPAPAVVLPTANGEARERLKREIVAACWALVLLGCCVYSVVYMPPKPFAELSAPPPAPPQSTGTEAPLTLPPGIGLRSPTDVEVEVSYALPTPAGQSRAQRAAIATLPLGLGLIYLLAMSLFSRVRRQQASQIEEKLPRLRLSAHGERLLDPARMGQLAQRLRRPGTLPGSRLDGNATAIASAKAAGRPQLRYGDVRQPCEHILLIEQASFTDHQAELFRQFGEHMLVEGVRIQTMMFTGAPLQCWRHGEPDRQVSLIDLLNANPSTRLLLAAGAHTLVDARSGEPFGWVELFQACALRVLLTPDGAVSWGRDEDGLMQAGFFVLPASEQGLTQLAGLLEVSKEDGAVRSVAHGARWLGPRRLPSMIDNDPERWLSPVPATTQNIERLFAQLSSYLGPAGFAWLAATAVFPRLWLHLTVKVGRVVGTTRPAVKTDGAPPTSRVQGVDHDTLLLMARLPWFRQGFMPDYLRHALLNRLNRRIADDVRLCVAHMIVRDVAVGDVIHDLDLTRFGAAERKKLLTEAEAILARLPADERAAFHPMREFVAGRRVVANQALFEGWQQRALGTLNKGGVVALALVASWLIWTVTLPAQDDGARRKVRLSDLLVAHEEWHKSDRKFGAQLRLSGVTLDDVNLTGANLEKAVIRGSSIKRASLARASLAGADFSDTEFESSDLRKADLINARMSGVRMTDVLANAAETSGADLTDAVLNNVDLSQANLHPGAGVVGIDPPEGKNRSHWAEETNLKGVVLFNVDLAGVELVRRQLEQLCAAQLGPNGRSGIRNLDIRRQVAAACDVEPPTGGSPAARFERAFAGLAADPGLIDEIRFLLGIGGSLVFRRLTELIELPVRTDEQKTQLLRLARAIETSAELNDNGVGGVLQGTIALQEALKKMQKGSQEERAVRWAVRRSERLPPPPPPIPVAACRHVRHGIERYELDERRTRESGWRRGGSSPAQWCEEYKTQLNKQFGEALTTIIPPSGERTRYAGKLPFPQSSPQFTEFNYTCTIHVQARPVYNLRVSEACQPGAKAQ